MSIDKDINQSKFRNEHQRAFVNLIYTYNWATEKFKAFLLCEDLTMQQFNILRILRGSEEPLSTLQIRARMLDKMSDTSRIVDRLVLKGLAQKCISKEDKRLVDVTISAAGKVLLARLDQKSDAFDQIIGAITSEEATELNRLLDKIRNSH